MATFTLVLDTRSKLKSGKYNLSIRVINGKEQIYLNLAKMTEEQYNRIFVKKSMDASSIEFRKKCNENLTKSEKLYTDVKPFNKQKFRLLFFQKEIEKKDSLLLKDLFDRFITNYTTLKITSQKHYKYTKLLFEKFSPNASVIDVNLSFINQFVKERNNEGVSQSTIESNLRNLRRIVNYFISEEPIIPNNYQYPFGKRGYSIQNLFPSKLVLTNDEIKSVINLKDFDSQKEEYARDIWILLYRCNGINFADLLRMKWSDIRGGCLEFYRKKTETTRKTNRKKIMVPLTKELKSLIEKVGVKGSPFILGKLNDDYTEKMFDNKNHKLKGQINAQLEIISQKLNLSVPLRTKTARDSYATTLKRAGVSKDRIGEMMGHSNSIVTEHYLASLDRETVFEVNKHLL
jgi:integrase